MMNRTRGGAGMPGVGLLGEAPGLGERREPMGRGFKRMMSGDRMGGVGAERMPGRRPMANPRAGEGLMGNAPMDRRRIPAETGLGRRDQFDAYDRPNVGGLLDEPDHRVDRLRPVERRPLLEDLEVRRGALDDGRRGGSGLLDHRAEARAMVEQRMGQFAADRGGLLEEDMGFREQEEGRRLLERAEFREPRGMEGREIMMDRERRMADMDDGRRGLLEQRGLRMAAVEQRDFRDPVEVERQHYHEVEQRRGLMDQARQTMEAQDIRRGLRDQARVARVDPLEMRRGLLDQPRQAGLMDTPDMRRGLLDQPRQGLLDLPERQDGLLERPRRRPGYEPRLDRQTEILEKADLQMRLLQEEQMQMEVERVNQEMLEQHQRENEVREMQQRAIATMQQQRPTPQEAMLKAQMQAQRGKRPGPGDGLLGNAPMPGGPGRGPGRQGPPRRAPAIPSLLDMGGKPGLRKRPSDDTRPADSKRPRTWQSGGSSDRPQRDTRRDTRSRDTRERSSRDADSGRKSRFESSSASRSKDRKDLPKKSSSEVKSEDKKTDKKDVKKDDKKTNKKDEKKDTTVVSITMDDSKYDPSEPTEDEEKGQQGEEHMREDHIDEEKEESEEGKSESEKNETGLTVTVNKKGRSVNDPDKKVEDWPDKMYKCNVCSVKCFNEASFGRHMNGVRHKKMMDAVMRSSSRKAALFSARKQAEEHLRNIEGTKKPGGTETSPKPARKEPTETLCKTCDKMFSGSFKDHKESPEHKIREDRSKAGCKICNVTTFKCFTDYVGHLKGDWHIKKKRQTSWPECKVCDQRFKSPRKFVQHCKTDHHKKNKKDAGEEDDELKDLEELVTLDTVGFEEDIQTAADTFVKPAGSVGKSKVSTSTPRAGSKPLTIETITPVKASDEEEEVIPEQYDPHAVVGGKYIVPVSGFFCKLCHKFYNNEQAARVSHCQSQTHYEKLLKFIAAKKMKSGASQQKADSSDAKDDQSGNAPANDSHLNGSKEGDQSSKQEVSTYETADEHESTLHEDGKQEEDTSAAITVTPSIPEASSVIKKKATPRGGPKARRGRKL